MEKFYLVTDSVDLIKRLLPIGVKLVQLRIKDTPLDQLRQRIYEAKLYCEKYNAQLVLNDYWQLALELGVNFVHLGQEDLVNADFKALNQENIHFGLSTHDEAELDLALSYNPHYIALGPIYPTKLKKMNCPPQGLERITLWKQKIKDIPLVAIGGIVPERIENVLRAGADSAAVVTDIQYAADPIQRCNEWFSHIQKSYS
ncbi:Thiamine monophosphate synthase (ThiE) (PDB:1G4T) (PUBMED:19060138) [Commensalibacter communis]|uniref:thiamine phosphate synthase n=1 Tax=Commensalibacter communis TaxID=2972786 RepID=UPI0022FF67B5|nr:thiamine phosphate synthase [Commensalibacter communis]CAI3942736.1 Thiamine monophosphate synthase (ThiE) (PDB:1G4T) (PUBMED:19060138) [Commensalibacter communis]